MEIKKLKLECIEAIEYWALNSLQEKPIIKLLISKRLKGFPRGDFVAETGRGKLYDFDAIKVLHWLKKNEIDCGLII